MVSNEEDDNNLGHPLLSCSWKRLLWYQSFILTTKNATAVVVFYLFSSHHNILFEEDLFFADVFYLYSGTWPEWDLLFLPRPLNGWCANIRSVRRTVNWTRPLSAAPFEWVDGAEEVEVERKQSLSGSPHQGIKIMMLVWFRKGSTTVWFLCFVLTGSFVNWVTHWGVVSVAVKRTEPFVVIWLICINAEPLLLFT